MGDADDAKEVASDLEQFEGAWGDSETASDFMEELLPPQEYKCGVQDFSWLKADTGNRGLKVMFEIIEPAVALDFTNDEKGKKVGVRGKIIEHVFWITAKNLPFVKRDVLKITGRELDSPKELMDINWMECFVEIVLKHDTYEGRTRNKVAFFNEWSPDTVRAPGDAPATEESGEDIPF